MTPPIVQVSAAIVAAVVERAPGEDIMRDARGLSFFVCSKKMVCLLIKRGYVNPMSNEVA